MCPEADARRAFIQMGQSIERADSWFNILLMRIGDDIILVDAGEGGRPKGGLLPQSLSDMGLAPEDVTLIIITHAHGDHVNGLLDDNGAPVFPNATYVITKTELAFWIDNMNAGAADQRPILDAVQASGLRLIDPDETIVEGLTAMPLPGHTPGHIGLTLESEGERLVHLADLVHSPMQFAHPEWSAKFDRDTSQSVPTRIAALTQAANDQTRVFFYHIAYPGLRHVHQAGSGFIRRGD